MQVPSCSQTSKAKGYISNFLSTFPHWPGCYHIMNYKQFYLALVIALHTSYEDLKEYYKLQLHRTIPRWTGLAAVGNYFNTQWSLAIWGIADSSSKSREFKQREEKCLWYKGDVIRQDINQHLTCSVFTILSLSWKRSQYQIQKTMKPNFSKKFFICYLRQTPAEPC